MAYSLLRITSDGSLTTIPLTFPFFDKTHVVVSVGSIELPGGGYTWVWLNDTTIKISPAVVIGVEVVVRRRTPYADILNIFNAGAVFDERTMDENFRQLLFSFQEALESNKSTDVYNDLNIHGYRVTNIGNAVTGRDAVPYAQYQADTQGAYQQRLAAESAATISTSKAAEATAAAATAANNAVAASNSLIVSTATTTATSTTNTLLTPLTSRVVALETASTCLVNAIGTGAPHETISVALPTNIAKNTRYVLQNPFGNNTPVLCFAEVKRANGKWAIPGWLFVNNTGSTGAIASYVQGEGIVIQTGLVGVAGHDVYQGGGSGTDTGGVSVDNLPCRVFIRKL